jgi:hypothetical protein
MEKHAPKGGEDLSQPRPAANETTTPYATSYDFCRIFNEQMSGLYLLSLLLTLDQEKAERCFVSGLSSCAEENRVFHAWANSWARRAIVQNAIRMLAPNTRIKSLPREREAQHVADLRDYTESERNILLLVTDLSSLERFVFVMSILEGFSDQDCAMLLGCSRRDVLEARLRAVQHVARLHGDRLMAVGEGQAARAHFGAGMELFVDGGDKAI